MQKHNLHLAYFLTLIFFSVLISVLRYIDFNNISQNLEKPLIKIYTHAQKIISNTKKIDNNFSKKNDNPPKKDIDKANKIERNVINEINALPKEQPQTLQTEKNEKHNIEITKDLAVIEKQNNIQQISLQSTIVKNDIQNAKDNDILTLPIKKNNNIEHNTNDKIIEKKENLEPAQNQNVIQKSYKDNIQPTQTSIVRTKSIVETQSKIYNETEVELKPRIKKKVEPLYPPAALNRQIEGFVELEFLVDKDGGVKDPKVITAVPKNYFEISAITAIKQWAFQPGIINNSPVATKCKIKINFKLD